ncbi:NAD(P)-dependent oxidoreductase [Pseudomonas sp. R2.Fl]|nr:NAD(P)-dependent oxidoreductase [Pseudomonas sp. R2.Fl]
MNRDFSSATVGFIGLGNMGFPMAGNLASRGFKLIVLDANKEAVSRFVSAHGASAAADAAELAGQVDVLILMVPDGRIVQSILLDEKDRMSTASRLKKGAVVIDMSSSAPMGTRQLGEELARHDVAMIDAPVSGGVGRAKTGMLAVMTGGDPALADSLSPILDAMCGTRIHVGPLGAGHAMKALNNYVSAAGLLAACEAVRVAQEFGIDGQHAVDALNASTGRNNSTENKVSQFVLSEKYNSGFSYALMRKDLETALRLAQDLHVTAPLAESFVPICSKGEAIVGKQADHTEIARLVHASA